MIGYTRLVRSAVLRNLARILLPSVDGRPPRMRTGKSKCYASRPQARKCQRGNHFWFQGTTRTRGRVEIVNYMLTAASQSLSPAWIATCGAVQASWFVV